VRQAASGPGAAPVLDEAVLHRLIGVRKVMCDQLLHLADMSCRSNITVQIVPAGIGAHLRLLGGFAIARPVLIRPPAVGKPGERRPGTSA
jgi:uncharacterized protein DUF5753